MSHLSSRILIEYAFFLARVIRFEEFLEFDFESHFFRLIFSVR